MHYIEGGWPGSNEKDIDFFREAKKLKIPPRQAWPPLAARVAPMPRWKKDKQVALLLAKPETPVVTLVCKTSMLHVTEILRTTPQENLAMIRDTVAYLVQAGP